MLFYANSFREEDKDTKSLNLCKKKKKNRLGSTDIAYSPKEPDTME